MNKVDLIFKISQLFKIIDKLPFLKYILKFIREIKRIYHYLTYMKSKDTLIFRKKFSRGATNKPSQKGKWIF